MRLERFGRNGGVVLALADWRDVVALELSSPQVALVTDPPYGVNHRANSGRYSGQGFKNGYGKATWAGKPIAGDHDTTERDAALERIPWRSAIVFGKWKAERPQNVREMLVWDKGDGVGMGDTRLPWKPNWEEVYVLGEGFAGPRTSGVLRYTMPTWQTKAALGGARVHQHQKPVPMMLELVQKSPADLPVMDPFMGSGSTGVAAVRLGRQFIGCEVDPNTFETACERISKAVGEPVEYQGLLF